MVRTVKACLKRKKKPGRKPKLIVEDQILMMLQYLREYSRVSARKILSECAVTKNDNYTKSNYHYHRSILNIIDNETLLLILALTLENIGLITILEKSGKCPNLTSVVLSIKSKIY